MPKHFHYWQTGIQDYKMGQLFRQVTKYLPEVCDGVFIEIGSDRLEGSTMFLAEVANAHKTVLHSIDMQKEPQFRINHESIIWHTEIGSIWCKNKWPEIAKQIDLLHLDNYDFCYYPLDNNKSHFIWNKKTYHDIKGVDWPQQFTEFANLPLNLQEECRLLLNIPVELLSKSLSELYADKGLLLSNKECQVEHFCQLLSLMPWITDQSLIIFDDTFKYNDCWIGKNGPGVVYLKSLGFSIIQSDGTAVIMRKNNDNL